MFKVVLPLFNFDYFQLINLFIYYFLLHWLPISPDASLYFYIFVYPQLIKFIYSDVQKSWATTHFFMFYNAYYIMQQFIEKCNHMEKYSI